VQILLVCHLSFAELPDLVDIDITGSTTVRIGNQLPVRRSHVRTLAAAARERLARSPKPRQGNVDQSDVGRLAMFWTVNWLQWLEIRLQLSICDVPYCSTALSAH